MFGRSESTLDFVTLKKIVLEYHRPDDEDKWDRMLQGLAPAPGDEPGRDFQKTGWAHMLERVEDPAPAGVSQLAKRKSRSSSWIVVENYWEKRRAKEAADVAREEETERLIAAREAKEVNKKHLNIIFDILVFLVLYSV